MSLDRFKRAQALRRDGTDAEAKLLEPSAQSPNRWFQIRSAGADRGLYRRLRLPGARLIVEVDGGQHADSARDLMRDSVLAAEGYRTVRIWNNEVMGNIDGVLQVILDALLEL